MNDTSIKKNILVLTSSFPHFFGSVEGGGSFIYSLCKELTQNFDVTVLTPYVSGLKCEEIWESVKIKRFKYLPFRGHRFFYNGLSQTLKEKKAGYLLLPFLIIAFFFNIHNTVKRDKIDIINAHWIIPQGFLAVLYSSLIRSNVKNLVTIHGSDLNNFSTGFFSKIVKAILKKANTVTVVSEPLKKIAVSIYSDKEYHVIPMGVDIEKFRFRNSAFEKKEILFVGRLSREKGCEYLLKAAPYVFKKIPGSKITIVGDGILKVKLVRLAGELGITDNVKFLGFINNEKLPEYYSRCNCLVMPSESEGSPVVLAEAMCCGAIPVTSDIPIFKTLIDYNNTGLYSSVFDPENYASEIIKALSFSSEKINIMKHDISTAARNIFSWDRIGSTYIKILNNLNN